METDFDDFFCKSIAFKRALVAFYMFEKYKDNIFAFRAKKPKRIANFDEINGLWADVLILHSFYGKIYTKIYRVRKSKKEIFYIYENTNFFVDLLYLILASLNIKRFSFQERQNEHEYNKKNYDI